MFRLCYRDGRSNSPNPFFVHHTPTFYWEHVFISCGNYVCYPPGGQSSYFPRANQNLFSQLHVDRKFTFIPLSCLEIPYFLRIFSYPFALFINDWDHLQHRALLGNRSLVMLLLASSSFC